MKSLPDESRLRVSVAVLDSGEREVALECAEGDELVVIGLSAESARTLAKQILEASAVAAMPVGAALAYAKAAGLRVEPRARATTEGRRGT